VIMKGADVDTAGSGIIDIIRYLGRGEKVMEDGHLIADWDMIESRG
jgi:hypothetical protein